MVPAELESGVGGDEDRGWLAEDGTTTRRTAGATRLALETNTPFRALNSAIEVCTVTSRWEVPEVQVQRPWNPCRSRENKELPEAPKQGLLR